MTKNYQNKDFQRLIRNIRKALPWLATVLLIGVYVVSAIAGGVFLSRLMVNVAGGITLAYCIGAAIQATRALLVFFPQLNPSRPSFSMTGEVIAVTMGVISIAEIIGLTMASNMAAPVAASLSILMLAGVGVELFLLREIKFATEIELYNDESHWTNLQDFYKARKVFKARLEQLKDFELSEESPALPPIELGMLGGVDTEPTQKTDIDVEEILTHRNGNGLGN